MARTASGPPAWKELANGRYLSALAGLERAYVSWEATPAAHNFLMWTLNAVDPWGERAWSFMPRAQVSDDVTLSDINPALMLARVFQRHRVLILQERHAAPETRYFGARLLKAAAEAGASHLAFEHSFQVGLTAFEQSGTVYPLTEPYAFDPSRAALLRAARKAGLKLMAFDANPRQLRPRTGQGPEAINRQRERLMAENILELILRPNPRARVVVWTGEQHALKETPPGGWGPFMATWLQTLTHEEPYCVGQEIVDRFELADGPRLIGGGHRWLAERGLDAIVLHHRGPSPAAAHWLRDGTLDLRMPARCAQLVQALPAIEGEGAVPVAQQLVGEETEVSMWVPAGEYAVRAGKPR